MTRTTLTAKLTLPALALVTLLAAGPAAAAAGRPGRAGRDAVRTYRAALARVGLSEEQKDAIATIAEQARAAGAALRAQHQADRAQLRVLLTAPDPDPAAIGTLMLKLKNDREIMREQRRATHEATLAVLDEQQRIAFEAYLDAFRSVQRRGLRGRR